MAGAIQDFIKRLVAAGYCVAIKDSVTVVSSIGIVAGVQYDDVGQYTVFLREPGVTFNGPPGHEVIPSVCAVANVPRIVTCTMISPTAMGVFLFDETGDTVDGPFTFQILLSERAGGDPLPSPGT